MKSISSQLRKLNSVFPWVRKGAQKNLIEIGLPAVKEIIAALDTRYAPIATEGFDSSIDSFSELNGALRRYPLLLDALAKIGRPALEELQKAFGHPNLNVRVAAIEAMGRIAHPSSVDLLLPFLDSSKSEERQWAIYALGNMRSPTAFNRIVAALDDENVYVREAALLGLGDFGNTSVLPRLEQIAESDKTLVENYGRTLGHVAKEAIEKIHKRDNR
jgi:hypothetical protein